jgi:hypothetical protein
LLIDPHLLDRKKKSIPESTFKGDKDTERTLTDWLFSWLPSEDKKKARTEKEHLAIGEKRTKDKQQSSSKTLLTWGIGVGKNEKQDKRDSNRLASN